MEMCTSNVRDFSSSTTLRRQSLEEKKGSSIFDTSE